MECICPPNPHAWNEHVNARANQPNPQPAAKRAQSGSQGTRVSALDHLGNQADDKADGIEAPNGPQARVSRNLRNQINQRRGGVLRRLGGNKMDNHPDNHRPENPVQAGEDAGMASALRNEEARQCDRVFGKLREDSTESRPNDRLNNPAHLKVKAHNGSRSVSNNSNGNSAWQGSYRK